MIIILTASQLNQGQRKTIINAKKWFKSSRKNSYPLVITGPAGTGKTAIMPSIISELRIPDDKCVILAIAGTAVTNLQQRFADEGRNVQASTIAKYLYKPLTIYKFIPMFNQSNQETIDDPHMVIEYLKYKTTLPDDQLTRLKTKLKVDVMKRNSKFSGFQKELLSVKKHLSDVDNIVLKIDVKFTSLSRKDRTEQIVIVDEAGMVPQKDVDSLIRIGVPIILCGDKDQLGPVNPQNKPEYSQNEYIQDQNYRYYNELTQLMRQGATSPVLELANAIRNSQDITPYYKDSNNENGSIKIMTRENAVKMQQNGQNFWQALITYGAIQATSGDWIALCHRNDYVSGFNIQAHNVFQSINKLQPAIVHEDEPLLITMNNKKSMDLTNGTSCIIKEIHKRHTFYVIADIEVNNKIFYNVAINTYEMYNPKVNQNFNRPTSKIDTLQAFYNANDQQYNQDELEQYKRDILSVTNDELTQDKDLNDADYLLFVTYGYAMTIHKSQGKEWHTVVLLSTQPSRNWPSSNFQNKELYYTAVTRTKFTLNIVDVNLTTQFF